MFHIMALALLVGAPTDLRYYEGQWRCHGTESEQMGTLSVERGLSDLYYVFTWQDAKVDPPLAGKTVTFAQDDKHHAGHFWRSGFSRDQSLVRLETSGWVEDTLVWTGDIVGHGAESQYIRITDKQQDTSTYATVYETSDDGVTFTVRDTGVCTKEE